MSLNLAKTKVVHFRKKTRNRTRSEHRFPFNNEEIEFAGQYKYLGSLLTEHLEWAKAVEEIYRKVNRALALLNRKARSCGGFHFNT